MYVLTVLVTAALLEIGGDAAIRYGLLRSSGLAMLLGIGLLVAYGFAVNADRSIDFGRLMGLYIVVFFVTSQVVAAVVFGQRPTPALLIGGACIGLGGVVIALSGPR